MEAEVPSEAPAKRREAEIDIPEARRKRFVVETGTLATLCFDSKLGGCISFSSAEVVYFMTAAINL